MPDEATSSAAENDDVFTGLLTRLSTLQGVVQQHGQGTGKPVAKVRLSSRQSSEFYKELESIKLELHSLRDGVSKRAVAPRAVGGSGVWMSSVLVLSLALGMFFFTMANRRINAAFAASGGTLVTLLEANAPYAEVVAALGRPVVEYARLDGHRVGVFSLHDANKDAKLRTVSMVFDQDRLIKIED